MQRRSPAALARSLRSAWQHRGSESLGGGRTGGQVLCTSMGLLLATHGEVIVRSRSFVVLVAALGGALLSACAGSGSSHADSALPAAGAKGTASSRAPSGTRRTMSSANCTNAALGSHAFVGGGLNGVAAGYESFVGAGGGNEACDEDSSVVAGQLNMIASGDEIDAADSFIGGGAQNLVSSADSAVVTGYENSAAGTDSFVGGGANNTLNGGATDGVLVGGAFNVVSSQYGFIGGGRSNSVTGEGAYIAAGGFNVASGEGAVVDGGFNSSASGTFATIPGGYVNSAAGSYSFAAGARASAPYTGNFVWSDGSDGDTILTVDENLSVPRPRVGRVHAVHESGQHGRRAARRRFGNVGVAERPQRQDRTIAPVDDDAVLDKVDALPISRWSYKSEHGVRHVGRWRRTSMRRSRSAKTIKSHHVDRRGRRRAGGDQSTARARWHARLPERRPAFGERSASRESGRARDGAACAR